MESVRVQLSGKRIKAYGRIVAGATATHPAFSASYDLQTDEAGATKRLRLTRHAGRARTPAAIARDEENMWLITDHQGRAARGAFAGALDVDVVFSPFFNALPIRRLGSTHTGRVGDVADGLRERARVVRHGGRLELHQRDGPTGSSCALRSPTPPSRVDEDGFILDYPGLAERI